MAAQESPILKGIAYGVSAPNPHNTQAWKFQITSDTGALLYIDERRLLQVTDPPARQAHIAAGCCVETLAVGMSGHGYATEVAWLPEGAHPLEEIGQKPVARIALHADSSVRPDELRDAIGQRQTNRRPYDGPPIAEHEAEQLRSAVASDDLELIVLHRPDAMRPLLDIFERAVAVELKTHHLYEETRIWFRFDERQRVEHRDGLSVPQLGFDGLVARVMEWSLFRGHPRAWFNAFSVNSGLASMRRGIQSARGLALLKSATNDQAAWLQAGRAFARVHLMLTRQGLTCQPYSQVLQEYPEMTALQAEFNELLGVQEPAKVQMAIRIGRARRTYRAPRREPRDFVSE